MKYGFIMFFAILVSIYTMGCGPKPIEPIPPSNFGNETVTYIGNGTLKEVPLDNIGKDNGSKETNNIVISGVVKNNNGRLLSGAKVVAIPIKEEEMKDDIEYEINDSATQCEASTNDKGEYSLEIIPSWYHIEVECDKHKKYSQKAKQYGGKNESKEIKDFELTAFSALVVEVYDEDGATPIEDATVYLRKSADDENGIKIEVKEDGRYRRDDIMPGDYIIIANSGSSSRKEGSEKIQLKSEEESTLRVTLKKIEEGIAVDSGMGDGATQN